MNHLHGIQTPVGNCIMGSFLKGMLLIIILGRLTNSSLHHLVKAYISVAAAFEKVKINANCRGKEDRPFMGAPWVCAKIDEKCVRVRKEFAHGSAPFFRDRCYFFAVAIQDRKSPDSPNRRDDSGKYPPSGIDQVIVLRKNCKSSPGTAKPLAGRREDVDVRKEEKEFSGQTQFLDIIVIDDVDFKRSMSPQEYSFNKPHKS